MKVTHGEIERREFVVQVGHHEARRRGSGWSPAQAVTCGSGRLLRARRAVVHPVVVDVGALEDQSAFLNFDALVGAYGGNTHAVRLTSIPSDGGHGESKQRSERQKNGGQWEQERSSVAAVVVAVETKE